MADTAQRFITKNKRLLTDKEIEETNEGSKKLEVAISSGTKDEIQQAIEYLNKVTAPFAERVMDEHVREALKGKKI